MSTRTLTSALALLFASTAHADPPINTWLTNPGFEVVGPSGPMTAYTGGGAGGWSAAANWSVFNNTPGTTRTRLFPSTAPDGDSQMMHVLTTGAENGVVQVFGPLNTGPDHVLSAVRVFVVSGQVGLGTGNGGNTHVDVTSSTTGQWELIQAPNGVIPANEIIIYSVGGPAEFYVDNASTSDALLDHFKCYDVDLLEGFEPVTVQLTDDFESQPVQVVRPAEVCNPVEKCHDGLCFAPQVPAGRLVCYETRDLRGTPEFKPRDITFSNQFGEQTFAVFQRADRLCVPSVLADPPGR